MPHKDRIQFSPPDKFKYAYLALAFVCLVVILSLSIFIIKNHSYKNFISYVEKTSEQIVDAICYTEVEVLSMNHTIHVSESDFDYLSSKIRDTYDALGVLSITIFNADRQTIYSQDRRMIKSVSDDDNVEKVLAAGKILSVYRNAQTVIDLLGERRERIDVLDVYVPVKNSAAVPIGVFHVVANATNYKLFYDHQSKTSINILVCSVLFMSLISFVTIIRQTNKLKDAYALLETFAITDRLTGLYNRSFYEEEVDRLVASRRYPIGIIVLDLDNLKYFNDTFGHAAGDEIICTMADTLKCSFRGDDLVARIGGDEFIVLLPNTTTDSLQLAIERLKSNVDSANKSVERHEVRYSVGTAIAENKSGLFEAIKLADSRMYENKASRRSDDKLCR